MNVASILARHARERPDTPAIVDVARGGFLASSRGARVRPGARSADRYRTLTFAELDDASARIAAHFRGAGLVRGDAVLVFHPMSAELYVVLVALLRLGLVAMFVDPGAGRARLDACCALHPPRALVAIPKAHALRLVARSLGRIPIKFSTGAWVPGARRLAHALDSDQLDFVEHMGADDPALVTFTSGGTGEPKAAVRTHGFLLAQHAALARSLSLDVESVDLTTLPIFVLANLASGVTSVIPDADLRRPGSIDPAPVVAQIRELGVTSTAASPALLERVARYCRERGESLPSLQKVFAGGAPVFPKAMHELAVVAPNAEIVAVYGSTEAEPIAEVAYSAMESSDVERMAGGGGLLAGRPVASIALRIVRDRWGSARGPYSSSEFAGEWTEVGEPGEIVVSGDHVLSGYLGGRGDEETKFRVDGSVWHRTGDLGYLDEAGRVWLLGRCGAGVDDDRGVLYPFAVESAANRFDGVRRSALALVRRRRVLVVELEGVWPDERIAALRAALDWASLDEVRVCRRIPLDRRHNAKVDYPALRRQLDRA
jgi:olefin beta-lactone synthetase